VEPIVKHASHITRDFVKAVKLDLIQANVTSTKLNVRLNYAASRTRILILVQIAMK
jgi:hypothetical protein